MFQVDRLEVRILVENWVDMLLGEGVDDSHCFSRVGLIEHFDPKLTPPQAENGISLLVTAYRGRRRTRILFDVGLTGSVLKHNMTVLGEDPDSIDQIVISHGHPDHYGGIHTFLGLLERKVPVTTHPDAFLPRYAVMGDGRVSPFYNQAFERAALADGGASIVETRQAVDLWGGIYTTGEIARENGFEGPPTDFRRGAPGLYQVSETGEFRLDGVWDEQGLVIDVKDRGLVILTGCGHAGVVNTIAQARQVCGDRPVEAVIGGFHLGFPTTPSENVDKTVNALNDADVRTIVPMHCSGLPAHVAFSLRAADRYVQPSVGTTLYFGS